VWSRHCNISIAGTIPRFIYTEENVLPYFLLVEVLLDGESQKCLRHRQTYDNDERAGQTSITQVVKNSFARDKPISITP
jgi:hypothetical protein